LTSKSLPSTIPVLSMVVLTMLDDTRQTLSKQDTILGAIRRAAKGPGCDENPHPDDREDYHYRVVVDVPGQDPGAKDVSLTFFFDSFERGIVGREAIKRCLASFDPALAKRFNGQVEDFAPKSLPSIIGKLEGLDHGEGKRHSAATSKKRTPSVKKDVPDVAVEGEDEVLKPEDVPAQEIEIDADSGLGGLARPALPTNRKKGKPTQQTLPNSLNEVKNSFLEICYKLDLGVLARNAERIDLGAITWGKTKQNPVLTMAIDIPGAHLKVKVDTGYRDYTKLMSALTATFEEAQKQNPSLSCREHMGSLTVSQRSRRR
jgi:hypothetical protein